MAPPGRIRSRLQVHDPQLYERRELLRYPQRYRTRSEPAAHVESYVTHFTTEKTGKRQILMGRYINITARNTWHAEGAVASGFLEDGRAIGRIDSRNAFDRTRHFLGRRTAEHSLPAD